VSTDMENEYNELLRYTLVLPASFEPTHGPKILENIKGLFSTKNIQPKLDLEAPAEKCDDIQEKSIYDIEDQKVMSSTENDSEFLKAESIVVGGDKSMDLINFDQSVIDKTDQANNSNLNLNEGMNIYTLVS
jgi:hypothetical protein